MTLKQTAIVTLGLTLALIADSAIAQTTASDSSNATPWSLGMSVASSPSPYRHYDRNIWPIPVVGYEGQSFYFRGLSAGYYLLHDQSDTLTVDVELASNYYRPSDSSDPRMKLLSNRKLSIMGGFSYQHHADWGVLSAHVATDVSGNSEGQYAEASYGYPIKSGKLTVTPSVGGRWSSDKFDNYYYGVSQREADRSGLAAYRAGSSVTPFLNIGAGYALTPSWNVFAQMRYTRLDDAIKNSPMVDKSATTSYWVGIIYRF